MVARGVSAIVARAARVAGFALALLALFALMSAKTFGTQYFGDIFHYLKHEFGTVLAVILIPVGLIVVVATIHFMQLWATKVVNVSDSVLATWAARTRADPRRPVLYLRPFSDDGAGRPGIIDLGSAYGSHEQHWARALELIGPTLSLDNPNRQWQEPGAVRVMPGPGGWQTTVVGLLIDAQVVALQAGLTSGLLWELRQAAALTRPENLLLIVPPWVNWAYFRASVQDILPTTLPAIGPASGYVYFDHDWTPHVQADLVGGLPDLSPVLQRLGILERVRRYYGQLRLLWVACAAQAVAMFVGAVGTTDARYGHVQSVWLPAGGVALATLLSSRRWRDVLVFIDGALPLLMLLICFWYRDDFQVYSDSFWPTRYYTPDSVEYAAGWLTFASIVILVATFFRGRRLLVSRLSRDAQAG
jgi:hypothetical protein